MNSPSKILVYSEFQLNARFCLLPHSFENRYNSPVIIETPWSLSFNRCFVRKCSAAKSVCCAANKYLTRR
jgi:hypothetical protein